MLLEYVGVLETIYPQLKLAPLLRQIEYWPSLYTVYRCGPYYMIYSRVYVRNSCHPSFVMYTLIQAAHCSVTCNFPDTILIGVAPVYSRDHCGYRLS